MKIANKYPPKVEVTIAAEIALAEQAIAAAFELLQHPKVGKVDQWHYPQSQKRET